MVSPLRNGTVLPAVAALVALSALTGTSSRPAGPSGLGNTATVASSSTPLAWAPPTLDNPVTVTLPPTGAQTVKMDNSRDYIIVLPTVRRVGPTNLVGGRNVVVMGGYTTLPTGSGPGDRSFTITDGGPGIVDGRIVHIEGVRIDGSGGGEGDAIGIKAPSAIVQLVNIRATGLRGTFTTVHADVIQVYGGVKELRIDHFTGASHYNNIYLRRENSPLEPAAGIVRISDTNMFGYVNPPGTNPVTTIRAIALGTQPADTDGGPGNDASATNCSLVNNVYLSTFYGQPPGTVRGTQFLFPNDRMKSAAVPCTAVLAADGRSADWPIWRDTKVFGAMTVGPPPGGDFAPAAAVGLRYVSPGYAAP